MQRMIDESYVKENERNGKLQKDTGVMDHAGLSWRDVKPKNKIDLNRDGYAFALDRRTDT